MTAEMYQQVTGQLRGHAKVAPGFMAHAATPTPNGYRITEIWESADDLNAFVQAHVLSVA